MKLNSRLKRSQRIASGFMALLMVTLAPVLMMGARSAEEVEAEQKQLEQERQELQAKLEQLREDEAQKQEYQETLEKKIQVLETQISTANRDIEELNGSINELTLKLDKSKDEMSDTIEQFRQRPRPGAAQAVQKDIGQVFLETQGLTSVVFQPGNIR